MLDLSLFRSGFHCVVDRRVAALSGRLRDVL